MRTHEQVVISEFRGRWQRGEVESCPADHSPDEKNCAFGFKSVKSRPQFSTYIDTLLEMGSNREGTFIIRVHPYIISAYVDTSFHPAETRLLVWYSDGKLFDSSLGFLDANAIFSVTPDSLNDDFSVLNMNNRCYISFHFREFGDAFIPLQVYDFADGTNVTRNALGAKPASATTSITEPAAGNVDAGQYVLAVAYETASGFITPPQAVANRATFTASGAKNIQFNGIPTGGAEIIGRYLLSSKVFPTIVGSVDDYELFFIPGGHITDNTTTVQAVNYYSTDLVDSAEYLKDLQETQVSVLGMCEYNGRMVLWADPNEPNNIKLSQPGKPESFQSIDCSLPISVNSTGQARKCVSFRGNLMIHLNNSTKVTRDTGEEPANWDVVDVDNAIGTEIYGVGEIYYGDGGSADSYIVAHRSGIYLFNGVFQKPALTFTIEDLWSGEFSGSGTQPSQESSFFNRCQVKVDPMNKRIYATYFQQVDDLFVPRILYGDYSEGLDSQHIKWSSWIYYEDLDFRQVLADPPYQNWIQIILDASFEVKVLVPDLSAYSLGLVGGSTLAQTVAENFVPKYSTAFFGNNQDGDDGIYHLGTIRSRICQNTNSTEAQQCVNISVTNLEGQSIVDLGDAVLAAQSTTDRYYSDIEWLANVKDEAMSVIFTGVVENSGDKKVPSSFLIQKIRLYLKKIYNFRPLMRRIACEVQNIAPVMAVPDGQIFLDIGGTHTMGGASIVIMSDVDANGGVEQLTLTMTPDNVDDHCDIILNMTTGITFQSGSDISSAMVIRGTLTNINNAINGMVIRNTRGNDNDNITLTCIANDLGNSGAGGPLTDTKTLVFTLRAS